VQDGKRHGQGTWKANTGWYVGGWADDFQCGAGKQEWSDGRMYEGQFQKGKFHGHGRMEWNTPSGKMIYEGQYHNDQKHGQGQFIWPDGRIYKGEWEAGKRHGKGTYINAKGDPREGIWQDDKLENWSTANP